MPYNTDSLKANLTNPQRVYLWEAIIPNPLGGGDTEAFTLRCQTATLPGRSVGTIQIDYKQGPGFRVPGKNRYPQSWAVTILEGEDGKSRDFIYKWHQMIIHDMDEIGVGDALLKRDIYLRLLSTTGKEVRKIKMIGAYPSELPDFEMSMTTEDAVRFSCTFSYDKWVDET